MSDETGPKSAYELAMERLRKQDQDAGITRELPTETQKAAIAEIRNFYDARLAQLQVLHESQLRGLFDPAARDALDEEYRRDCERLTSERDAKVDEARTR